ncbi:MAG TPA: DUF6655 family protein [Pirellulales bacterium]|jgi:hypothetical protein|nr:DUF6655 family protein [Pirellulales bacterium]
MSLRWLTCFVCALPTIVGCATTKSSDTARTGIEQLLISSATDQALDKVNFEPIRNAKVFVETKYLDCVDKNYIIVSVHQRLLRNGSTLVDKPEEAQVILEVGSGAVGTDRQEFFVGMPQIPLPPPSPISIPKLELFTRTRAMGTAKLTVLAYDAQTRVAVIDSGRLLARSDYKQWHVMGASPVVSGRVPAELNAATGEHESPVTLPLVAGRSTGAVR